MSNLQRRLDALEQEIQQPADGDTEDWRAGLTPERIQAIESFVNEALDIESDNAKLKVWLTARGMTEDEYWALPWQEGEHFVLETMMKECGTI